MTRNIKCEKPITILSIIALILSILSVFINFYISSMLALVSSLLLTIYFKKYCKQCEATILYPIACGLIAMPGFLNFMMVEIEYLPPRYIITNIIIIIQAVSFTLLIINAIKGLNIKKYTIIAVSAAIIYKLSIFMFNILSMRYVQINTLTYLVIDFLCAIFLYLSLLLFGLNNRIPALISKSAQKENEDIEKMSPQEELRLLKSYLDSEIITKEEYESKRADIINKL